MSVFLACQGFRICLYVKLLNLAILQDISRREDYYEQITIAKSRGFGILVQNHLLIWGLEP